MYEADKEEIPENTCATILCAVYTATHNPIAIALPGKNSELEYAISQLTSFVKRLCHTDLVVRSDGESAITAIVDKLLADIMKARVQTKVRPAETRRYSSQSLGAVGRMQATTQAQVRTLKTALETRIKKHVVASMAIWPWLVRHTAWLIERFQMRANGFTIYEHCYGSRYVGIVLRFGEAAVFRHPVGTAASRAEKTGKQLRKAKAANKFDMGVWLGKAYEIDERYFGTSDGVFTARTCRRVVAKEQWVAERLVAVTGLP